MYNHNKAQHSKNRVYISWDILYFSGLISTPLWPFVDYITVKEPHMNFFMMGKENRHGDVPCFYSCVQVFCVFRMPLSKATWIKLAKLATSTHQRAHQVINGPLNRYAKLPVAHALGMPWTFSPSPISKQSASSRSRHASRRVCHARAVIHVGIANARWRKKRSRHSWRMRSTQFGVSGKKPMRLMAH